MRHYYRSSIIVPANLDVVRVGVSSMYPKISIVMPSYNQVAFIEESIQSVLAQNYPALEFLILDGGSTDGSKEIIARYSKHLAYWHSKPDKGQTEALIRGFNLATGDLLGWINSDDVLMPNVLQNSASIYTKNPNIGILFGDYVLIDESSRITRCKLVPKNGIEWYAKRGLWVFSSTGVLFSRKGYDIVGGLHADLDFVMDADLYMRMLFQGVQYKHLGCYVGGFRRHKGAKTVVGLRNSRLEHLRAGEMYWPPNIAEKQKQSRWKILYWIFQILNGNLKMYFDTVLQRGKHWQEWAVPERE